MSARAIACLSVLALLAPALPAAAQDHSQHQHHAPPAKAKPKPKPKPAPAAPKPAVDHSQMDHSQMHHSQMEHSQMDHAQHPAPAPAYTPVPPPTQADRDAARPPTGGHAAHGDSIHSYVIFDRLEGFDQGMGWAAHAWVGNDEHRLWLRSEGEREEGALASAELELMYARPVSAWWDLGVGIRHDFKPGSAQDFLAVGVQGLAPYKIEVEATAYLGDGQAAARVEAGYDTLFSNRWILQSRVEANLHAQDDPQRHIGAGLSDVALGARLRFEVTRRFAPYIGLEREWSLGRTGDLRSAAGEARHETRVVAGVRFWF